MTSENSDAVALDSLEIKIAHLEHQVDVLSTELYHQQRDLQNMQERYELLLEHVQSLSRLGGGGNSEIEVPPHY